MAKADLDPAVNICPFNEIHDIGRPYFGFHGSLLWAAVVPSLNETCSQVIRPSNGPCKLPIWSFRIQSYPVGVTCASGNGLRFTPTCLGTDEGHWQMKTPHSSAQVNGLPGSVEFSTIILGFFQLVFASPCVHHEQTVTFIVVLCVCRSVIPPAVRLGHLPPH